MSIASLFQISYYFDNNAPSTFFGFWALVGILIALLVSGYVVGWKMQKTSGLVRYVATNLASLAVYVGWFSLLWMFFRYQGVLYLSWRLWPALIIVIALWQVVKIIRFVRVEYPRKVAAKEMVGEKESYLKKYKARRK